ncbi:MAG: hypothetical protein LBI42_10255 [Chitinispirillales bacterium]|jgi:hypothetical protein|nr:hypothetical protein [Chitinispirillales bacterium]
MKKLLTAASLTFLLCVYAQSSVPVQDMSPDALALEYYGLLNGQNTLNDDKSVLAMHMMRLHYSPAPTLRLSLGVGNSNFYVDQKVRCQTGFSLSAGAALFVPNIHPLISLTTGFDSYYVSGSSAEARSVGILNVPYAGVIIHMSEFVDLEIGGSYQFFDLQKRHPDDPAITTSIEEQIRIYSSLTLHDPESGVYLSGGLSSSTNQQKLDRKTFPTNTSVWFQFGIILKQDKETANSSEW